MENPVFWRGIEIVVKRGGDVSRFCDSFVLLSDPENGAI